MAGTRYGSKRMQELRTQIRPGGADCCQPAVWRRFSDGDNIAERFITGHGLSSGVAAVAAKWDNYEIAVNAIPFLVSQEHGYHLLLYHYRYADLQHPGGVQFGQDLLAGTQRTADSNSQHYDAFPGHHDSSLLPLPSWAGSTPLSL